MKILKPGRDPEVHEWSAECYCSGKGNGEHGCEALLLVTLSDLFKTYQSCMGRDETSFITFMCPQCGTLTDIKNTDGYSLERARSLSFEGIPMPGMARVRRAQEVLRSTGEYTPPHRLE